MLAREDKTAHLYARTREVMTGVELLRSAKRGDMIGDMSDSWHDWENWFRMLHETNAVMPVLISVPSVFRGQIWVAAASTVMDAACLAISTLDVKGLTGGKDLPSGGRGDVAGDRQRATHAGNSAVRLKLMLPTPAPTSMPPTTNCSPTAFQFVATARPADVPSWC